MLRRLLPLLTVAGLALCLCSALAEHRERQFGTVLPDFVPEWTFLPPHSYIDKPQWFACWDDYQFQFAVYRPAKTPRDGPPDDLPKIVIDDRGRQHGQFIDNPAAARWMADLHGPQWSWKAISFKGIATFSDRGVATIASSDDGRPPAFLPNFHTYRGKAFFLFTPAWLPTALAAMPAALWAVMWAPGVFRRRLRGGSACRICGYDLRATPQRCPECGHERDKDRLCGPE